VQAALHVAIRVRDLPLAPQAPSEDGGAGCPSMCPPWRELQHVLPYGLGPRRFLPQAPSEDGGIGGLSMRPPRRRLHHASPYGFGPRHLLPKLTLASMIFSATPGDLAASGDLSSPLLLFGGSANGCCPYFC
jgi:hypothetical protein